MSNTPHNLPEQPLVSIITPILNGSKYLRECLESVLGQNYLRIEHVFVDGGSTDSTLDILKDYASSNPERITYSTGKDNGVGSALNKGLSRAKGDILGWLDSDDLLETDAVASVVSFFQEHPDAMLVYGDCDIIGENGEYLDRRPVKDFNFWEAVTDRHFIYLPAVFYRRDVFIACGYYNDLGNDLDFYLRVAEKFPLHRIQKKLARWRRHSSSITASDEKTDRRRFYEDYVICRKYGGSMVCPRARRYIVATLLYKVGLYRRVNFSVLPWLRRHRISNKLLKIVKA